MQSLKTCDPWLNAWNRYIRAIGYGHTNGRNYPKIKVTLLIRKMQIQIGLCYRGVGTSDIMQSLALSSCKCKHFKNFNTGLLPI